LASYSAASARRTSDSTLSPQTKPVTPKLAVSAGPSASASTDEVLAEYLGLGQDDLRKLREAAVI
jgi:hypothetical protein